MRDHTRRAMTGYIGMPGMDGLETARRLRQLPGAESMLLVALTGWGQEADRERTAEAGFDHHLVKPVAVETIRELLFELNARSALAAGVPAQPS